MLRKAAVADQFYEGSQAGCLEELTGCLSEMDYHGALPTRITAALVPHAGWVFSGGLAGLAFDTILRVNQHVDTFILLGAAHRCQQECPVIYDRGQWETPLGQIAIDESVAASLVQAGAVADLAAHRDEHSIEVQVPFIQHLFPGAKIVPIIMPAADNGYERRFGQAIGRLMNDSTNKTIVCAASTDLTHYGPRYGFCPQGSGQRANRWAHEVNDKKFIDKALGLDAEGLLRTATQDGNACGPAAAAAAVAAARQAGCQKGYLLGHTNSLDVMKAKFHTSSEESVGYTAIVF